MPSFHTMKCVWGRKTDCREEENKGQCGNLREVRG